MTENRYRVETGIPREVRKAYLAQAQVWCEYPARFGDGEPDPTCRDFRHYVRCTEHEHCQCTGATLILVCERCWDKLLNEIRGKRYASEPVPEPQAPRQRPATPPNPPRERRGPELGNTSTTIRPGVKRHGGDE